MSDDLIRRSDAIKAVNKAKAEGMTECPTYYLGIVPTIEPKRGKWIEICDNSRLCSIIRNSCSECGEEWLPEFTKRFNFCPNCGADMRGKGDE